MGSASSQHRALLLPRSQTCLSKGFASMQELTAESSEVFSCKEAAGWKVAQSRELLSYFFVKGLKKIMIDCWIAPRTMHLMGRAKKRLWERLVRTATSRSLLPCGMRQVLQGCSRLPSPAVHAPLEGQQMLQGCSFLAEAQSTRCLALLCPQVIPAPSPCIPRDPARLEPGLTRASQREKAQYFRRRRGQLKFNVQANTSSPPLNQAAAIPNSG